MSSVLFFKNFTYYDENHPAPTIEGSEFQALLDLCFAHADAFSLRRCGWPGAKNGALEDALRPWLLGEYFSYGILNWFDLKRREKCYLYRACPETKDILLQHIHHLFDQEISLEPPGHQEYLRQKYEVYQRAGDEANDLFFAYLDGEGQARSEEQQEKVMERIYREARERCPNVFSEKDHYSHMEDPCFFWEGEMFFEIITHEQECLVQVLSPEFEKSLRKLGTWVDVSAESRLPLFLLNEAKGFKRYENEN